jgi:hypothetical protein
VQREVRTLVLRNVQLSTFFPDFVTEREIPIPSMASPYYRVVGARAIQKTGFPFGLSSVVLRTAANGKGNNLLSGTVSSSNEVTELAPSSSNVFGAGITFMQSSTSLFLRILTTNFNTSATYDVEVDIVEQGIASPPVISDNTLAKLRATQVFTPNQQVNCFALVNNRLYIGGTGIRDYLGILHVGLTIFDTTTGETITDRITGATPVINDIYVDPSNDDVYIFGNFSTINGFARTGLAKFNSAGVLQTWGATITHTASVALTRVRRDGDKFFICGAFTAVDGFTRNGLAKIFLSSGNIYSNFDAKITLDPNFSASIQCMELLGGVLYFFGNVKLLDIFGRNGMGCSVDPDTGFILNWAPVMGGAGTGNNIKDMGTDGTDLYVVGAPSAAPSRSIIARMTLFAPGGNDASFNLNPVFLSGGCTGQRLFVGSRYIGFTTDNNASVSNGVCLKADGTDVRSFLSIASFLGAGVFFDEVNGIILAGQITFNGQLYVNRFYP